MTPERLIYGLRKLWGKEPTENEILVGSFQAMWNDAHPDEFLYVDGRSGPHTKDAMRRASQSEAIVVAALEAGEVGIVLATAKR